MSEIIKDEFKNDVDRILNMTDKQAAEVLEKVQVWMNSGRRNGKTLLSLAYNKAIEKAIKSLRTQILFVCDQTKCENSSAKQGFCYATTDITHAANFRDAGDGIYVEKSPSIIHADLSELPDYTVTPDNNFINPELGESENEE